MASKDFKSASNKLYIEEEGVGGWQANNLQAGKENAIKSKQVAFIRRPVMKCAR